MARDERDLLDVLKFELKFLEDGGYGRSPHTPRRCQVEFEDSPTCPDFGDPTKPHSCAECPRELRGQVSQWRHIPLIDKGETIDYFYRRGTQLELLKLEEALSGWLRKQISRVEELREAEHSRNNSNRQERLRQQHLGDGFGQAYAVKRREMFIRGIEHKRVQLAAANADIAAGETSSWHHDWENDRRSAEALLSS